MYGILHTSEDVYAADVFNDDARNAIDAVYRFTVVAEV